MSYIKLSSRNQIVVPREAREAMRVKGGDELLVVVKGQTTLLLARPGKYSTALHGKGKGLYPKNYLDKEHRVW